MPPSCAASDAIRQVVSLHRLRVGLCRDPTNTRNLGSGTPDRSGYRICDHTQSGVPDVVSSIGCRSNGLELTSRTFCQLGGSGSPSGRRHWRPRRTAIGDLAAVPSQSGVHAPCCRAGGVIQIFITSVGFVTLGRDAVPRSLERAPGPGTRPSRLLGPSGDCGSSSGAEVSGEVVAEFLVLGPPPADLVAVGPRSCWRSESADSPEPTKSTPTHRGDRQPPHPAGRARRGGHGSRERFHDKAFDSEKRRRRHAQTAPELTGYPDVGITRFTWSRG